MRHGDAAGRAGLDFPFIEMNRVHCEQRRIDEARLLEARERALAGFLERLRDFAGRFVKVDLDAAVELVGHDPKPAEGFVRQGARRVRGEAAGDERMIDVPVVDEVGALAERLGGIR